MSNASPGRSLHPSTIIIVLAAEWHPKIFCARVVQCTDVGEGITEPPAEEYAMMLEVMMAHHPGWPHPPAFSWNAGMVMHILKSDPILRELEHVQMDGPGTAYLFFYDR